VSRGGWLTDWNKAKHHPWKSRVFLAVSFALMGLAIAALTDHLSPWWAAALIAGFCVGFGLFLGELGLRT